MGNHDRNRTASRFPGRSDQMTMLAMILPGVAVTYYGEEIGMVDKTDITWTDTKDPAGCNAGKDKYKSRSRDPVRTPYQWNFSKNAGINHTKLQIYLYLKISLPLSHTHTHTHARARARAHTCRELKTSVRELKKKCVTREFFNVKNHSDF